MNYSDANGHLSIRQIGASIWSFLKIMTPFIDLAGIAYLVASFLVPGLGKMKLIMNILASVYYAITIISCIEIIKARSTPHYKKVIAYADLIVSITKGILTWVGGRVNVFARRLLKSRRYLVEAVRAMDAILYTSFSGGRDLIAIVNNVYAR